MIFFAATGMALTHTASAQIPAGTRFLAQDSLGNPSWKDISSLLGGSGWSLTGNAGTNRNTQFLGTTDAVPLVFRTANTEKMTILSNGNVGIGLTQPGKMLQVHNGKQDSEDNNIMLSGAAPSMYFSQTAVQPNATPYNSPYARIGLSTRPTTFATTSQPGDFVIHSIAQGASILFALGVDAAGNNGVEKVRISSQGNLGVNTINPTAKLHVNGNARFQNLPAGTGRSLVVDDSGYVYIADKTTDDVAAMKEEIALLKQALADVQTQLAAIKSGSIEVVGNARNSSTLSASPNPFNGTATLKYSYPATATTAYMIISDINGSPIKRYDLRGTANGSVTITLDGNAQAGTYISNLEVDGKVVGSKKLIYNK
jgi:type II secretory pathway pseudopilin PulG